jgi:hypothetical protein
MRGGSSGTNPHHEGNMGKAGESILVQDIDDQVVSEGKMVWAKDAGGVGSCRAHQCLQSRYHRSRIARCDN